MADWIEGELRRQFRPVQAPPVLWDRIQRPPAPRHKTVRPLWFVPACAALLVLVTAGLLWGIRARVRDTGPLTDRDLRVLAEAAGDDVYPSDDPIRIRDWVKSRSHIDIELPSSRSESIHLLGAKLVRLRGSIIAAVAYRVGAGDATLIVSGHAPGRTSRKHLFTTGKTASGANLISWNMREQSYTIAFAGPGAPQESCRICHAASLGRL